MQVDGRSPLVILLTNVRKGRASDSRAALLVVERVGRVDEVARKDRRCSYRKAVGPAAEPRGEDLIAARRYSG